MKDNKNMILAIALSIVVLFGWQYFIAGPQTQKAEQAAKIEAQHQQQVKVAAAKAQAAAEASTKPGAVPTEEQLASRTFKTRAEAIAATSRVKIDTPSLIGSLNLMGARLDDLKLKGYHETVDKKSPIVTLLTPSSAPDSYFVEEGWANGSGGTLNLPSGTTVWSVDGPNHALTPGHPLTLSWDNGAGLIFHRTYSVDDHFLFTLTQSVENKTGNPVTLFPYAQVTRHGTPESYNSFIVHEGAAGVLGAKNRVSYTYDDLKKNKQEDISSSGGWLGFTTKYWSATVLPKPDTPINARFSYSMPGATPIYKASYVDSAPVTVAANTTATNKSYVFAGAKVESIVADYASKYGFDRFDMLIDWGWFSFLTKPMFLLLQFMHEILGNFGLGIMAVTILIKAVFFPLASRSYASMAAMRRVQPQMKAIQAEFKEDRAAQQKATMELYKREKINPLSGCWPMLIQIPVFYALYTVLFITIEMRHAPFFGWIQDLAAPDPTNIFTLFGLLQWDPTSVPIIGHFLVIGIWPLIMGITMWVQMKLNPPPPDPTQAMIFQLMPVIFTFTLGTFPAGLVIYYSWNNTLSVTQQYIIMKRHGVDVNLFENIINSFKRRKPASDKAGS